jgi:hypothetical protein
VTSARGFHAPPVSVVIPWCDRPELADTVRANRDRLPPHTEWIVVNGGGDRSVARAAVGDLHVTLAHLPMRRFAKGPCQNVGVALATSSLVLLLDADIVLEPAAWSEMAALVDDDHAVTLARIVDPHVRDARRLAPPRSSTTEVELDGRTVRVETSVVDPVAGERSAPGNVVLTRRRFEQVGGVYGGVVDANFLDIDLLIRLDLAGCRRVEAGRGVHVDPHPEPAGAGRHGRDARNAAHCLDRLRGGARLGTAAHDRRTWLPLAGIERSGDPGTPA